MYLLPLSPLCAACPHVLESSGDPAEPNPILESQVQQSSWLLAAKPILTLELGPQRQRALKPSKLQFICKEAWEPISVFHVSRPSEVARCCPSASNECKESAVWFMTRKLIFSSSGILIPRQILVNGVFQ